MLTKNIVEFLFEAASMQRWNDHIRVEGFSELDKQAHKAMILYVLAKYEEGTGAEIQWKKLIEGMLFEYIYRSFLTDIKPPVFHELVRECGRELNTWVYGEVERRLPDLNPDFFSSLRVWFDNGSVSLEKKLVSAAHYLATQWEFSIIYRLNEGRYGIEETKREIEAELLRHADLEGVRQIAFQGPIKNFVDLTGQLRYQRRWAQSTRVPNTSVLGHSLIVAMYGYFCNQGRKVSDAQVVEDFWRGLFHDLPEVLTRDIVSPIKRNVEGLDSVLNLIELKLINEKILPLIPESWHQEMLHLTKGFKEGTVMKACDNLSAYMEVKLSEAAGVTDFQLKRGGAALEAQYKGEVIDGIDFGKLFEELKHQ